MENNHISTFIRFCHGPCIFLLLILSVLRFVCVFLRTSFNNHFPLTCCSDVYYLSVLVPFYRSVSLLLRLRVLRDVFKPLFSLLSHYHVFFVTHYNCWRTLHLVPDWSSLLIHCHLRRLSSLYRFLSLSFLLCLCLDVQISWFFSRSISISLCRHAAQEYIRRQLEEEQRQLEILQQQLLQEQALLMVTIALPRATAAPPICAVCGPLPPLHAPEWQFHRGTDSRNPQSETLNMSATYLKDMEHKQCISYLQCLLFRSLIAWSIPFSWLDLKGFPKGCRKTVLSASISWENIQGEIRWIYFPQRGFSVPILSMSVFY